MEQLERGTELDGRAQIRIADQGGDIQTGAKGVQAKTGGELGFLFNAGVVAVAGQVLAGTNTQLGKAPGVKLSTDREPLGVIGVTKAFLLGQLQLGGQYMVVTGMGNSGSDLGLKL